MRLQDRIAELEDGIADALSDIYGAMNGLGDPHEACDFDGDKIAALTRTIHDSFDVLGLATGKLAALAHSALSVTTLPDSDPAQ